MADKDKDCDLERLGASRSDIVLETDATKCKVCKIGDVKFVKNEKAETFMIYTRDGTLIGSHQEYRCNNRTLPCRAGHYYGYVSLGENGNVDRPRCYENLALKKKFLVTSTQTAFSVDYLWDCLLQVVFSNATSESLAKIYNNLHFVNLPTDVMLRRVEAQRKRISEAIFLFAYLELGQRYGLPPIICGGVDNTILQNRIQIRDKFRETWSVNHKCEVKGCSSVLTLDGGMKPTRSLCAAKLQGIKEFKHSGMFVVCGCLRNPQPDSKYCGEHVGMSTPAMTSDKVSASTRTSLRDHRKKTAESKDAHQDDIYVIESIVEKQDDGELWKVKWLGFPEEKSTWEPSTNIQPWILSYYKEDLQRLGCPLPEPKIKHIKKAGDEVFYYLSWGNEKVKGNPWKGESFFSLASQDGDLMTQLEEDQSCNTKKTKDKRERRHLVGICVGTKPCGRVVLWDELYGSESLTQIYGILVEYLANLPTDGRDALKNILYDDACHLKKFSENPKRANLNSFTEHLASIPKHVDNFHFKNHVDPWCHQHCNPKDVRELDGINTESCEQTFRWVNKFTAVKSMNESRFFMFFTLVFDLHNLQMEGRLRSVAHPKSPLRWELLPEMEDWEGTLLNKENAPITDIEKQMDNLAIHNVEDSEAKLFCKQCGATYKKPGNLKAHIKKKHENQHKCDICNLSFDDIEALKEHVESHSYSCNICEETFSSSRSMQRHVQGHAKIFVCEECKEVFLDKKSLSSHMKCHLVCQICKRNCDSKFQLKRHILSHKP